MVAAYADDVAFRYGGTIARHAEAGYHVQFVFVADRVLSRRGARGR